MLQPGEGSAQPDRPARSLALALWAALGILQSYSRLILKQGIVFGHE